MRQFFLFLIISMLVFSCAPQKEVITKKQRYFWPPPPNDPKIEFIGFYRSSKDLPREKSFLKAFVGDTELEFRLRKPLGITSDGEGTVVITDMIPQGGTVWNFNENKVDFLTDEAAFGLTAGVCFDTTRLYVSDSKQNKVLVYTKSGRKPLYTIGDDEIDAPAGIVVNEALKRLYVVETKGFRVSVFDTETKKKLFTFGKAGDGEGEFNRPWGVALDKNGDVYVADGLNARVQIFDKDGKFITMFGKRGDKPGGFAQVKGIGVDSDGNIYVVDPLKAIQIFNRNGDLLGLLGAPGTKGIGAMNLPMGLFVDKNDRIYVVDQLNRAFHVYQYMNEEYKKKHPVETGDLKK